MILGWDRGFTTRGNGMKRYYHRSNAYRDFGPFIQTAAASKLLVKFCGLSYGPSRMHHEV